MLVLKPAIAALALGLGLAGCAGAGGSYNNKDHVWRPASGASSYETPAYRYDEPSAATRYVYYDRRPVVREQVVTRTYTYVDPYPSEVYPYRSTQRLYPYNDEDPQFRQLALRDLSQQGYSDFDGFVRRDGDYFVAANDELGRPVVLKIDNDTGRVLDVTYR